MESRDEAIMRLIEEAQHFIGCLPSGIDVDADEYDPSPEDMAAHLGGLALRKLDEARRLIDSSD